MFSIAMAATAVLGASAAIIVIGVRKYLLVVTVVGESMLPTLHHGDRILVVRRPLARLTSGDIVILRPPPFRPAEAAESQVTLGQASWLPHSTPNLYIHRQSAGASASGTLMVKRLVSTAGDRVPPAMRPVVGDEVVPAGTVLVLGDNHDRSTDSRAWGAVADNRLIGKMITKLRGA